MKVKKYGFIYAVILISAGAYSSPLFGQEDSEGGGGGVGEGEGVEAGPMELDYEKSIEEVFNEEEFNKKESQLEISEKVVSKRGLRVIQEAARQKVSIQIGGPGKKEEISPQIPQYYIVKKGDTLYYLSSYFFGNPDLWPAIWSLNPEITNPNWIYPGQSILIAPKEKKPEKIAPEEEAVPPPLPVFQMWKEGTIWVRNLGFVDKDIEEKTGQIIGSFEETMYLDMHHVVYIKFKKGRAPAPGSLETIYEVVSEVKDNEKRHIKYGKLVRILGRVKVDRVDEKHRIARAIVTDAVRPIERGDMVGPIKWEFKVIPPVPAGLDLEGKIIAPLEDVVGIGQHDVIFVNLGKKDGVSEGNIFDVLRKRDHYMEVLRKEDASPYFPWERIGKAMVIEALKSTSTCLVIESRRDIRVGDRVVLKRGE